MIKVDLMRFECFNMALYFPVYNLCAPFLYLFKITSLEKYNALKVDQLNVFNDKFYT